MIEFLKTLNPLREKRLISIVFVCTANCCRSPVGEILFEKMLLEEVGSKEALGATNILVESAGTHYSGYSMAGKTLEVLTREEGTPLTRCQAHQGRLISKIEEPDLILTMTMDHVQQIYYDFPGWDDKTFTLEGFVKYGLGQEPRDIPDPMGGTYEEFSRMKDTVKENLKLLVREFRNAGLLTRVRPLSLRRSF